MKKYLHKTHFVYVTNEGMFEFENKLTQEREVFETLREAKERIDTIEEQIENSLEEVTLIYFTDDEGIEEWVTKVLKERPDGSYMTLRGTPYLAEQRHYVFKEIPTVLTNMLEKWRDLRKEVENRYYEIRDYVELHADNAEDEQ